MSFSSDDVQGFYSNGIKSYQANSYADASQFFTKGLALEPNNRALLFNWGLSELKKKKLGLAIGAWRKVLALYPNFTPAQQALNYAILSLKNPLPTPEPGSFESFRNLILNRVTQTQLLSISLVLFLFAGFGGLKYLGKRKTALTEALPMPPFPFTSSALTFLFLLCFSLSGLKIFDSLQKRATVTAEQVAIRTGPNENETELFELFEGYEVVVKRSANDWSQIKVPGGITGWVPSNTLFLTSGN